MTTVLVFFLGDPLLILLFFVCIEDAVHAQEPEEAHVGAKAAEVDKCEDAVPNQNVEHDASKGIQVLLFVYFEEVDLNIQLYAINEPSEFKGLEDHACDTISFGLSCPRILHATPL